jgi:RNA polymerase sigma-70 factor (ECF subfamily)
MDIGEGKATLGRGGCSLDASESATEWDLIRDPAHVIQRYSPAIRRYFGVLIRNQHDAEEAAQEFFLRIIRVGFFRACRERGRFRDYLRRAVRNAALNFLRDRRGRGPGVLQLPLEPVAEGPWPGEDREWLAGWRRCLLKRAFRALAGHEQRSPGNLCYTVLCAVAKYPYESCEALAGRVGRRTGRPLSGAAFRKQVSRARRLLAVVLMNEVASTLDHPTREQVIEELAALGLWDRVRAHLPPDPS